MQFTPLHIKLAAFTLAMLPLLIENWRKASASNRSNAILLAGGLAYAGYQLATGAVQPTFGLFGGWLIVVAVSLGLAAAGMVPGGVAKSFAALAPWIGPWQFLAVVAIAMVTTAIIAFTRRKQVGIALAIYLTTCAMWLAMK